MRSSTIYILSAALLLMGCARSIEELARDLREGDWQARVSAVEEFAARGLVEYAALGLADDDSRVRNTAVARLSGMGDEAVPAVLAVLADNPEDETTLAASVEVLENLGARALDGVLAAVRYGGAWEAEMGYLVLRRVRGAEEELERMLADPPTVARLLASGLPRVRIAVLRDLTTREPEELEMLLELFSDGRAGQYMAATALTRPPEPLPGTELFGPPEAGTNVLNNFTALSLCLLSHRQRLLAAGEDASLRDGMAGSTEPVYVSFYDEAPWRPFYTNCFRAAERAKERGEPFDNLTLEQFVEIMGVLANFYHAVSEAHFDFEGSARLLGFSREFAYWRGELAGLLSDGG